MLARQIETICSESKENRTITAYAINVHLFQDTKPSIQFYKPHDSISILGQKA
jgi:hypothetical protein